MFQLQDQSNYVGKVDTMNIPEPKPTPLANQISDEFQELNQRQEKIISAIEDKLHYLIDKRVPKDDCGDKCVTGINDFRTTIGYRLVDLRINTNKLDQILKHLEEII